MEGDSFDDSGKTKTASRTKLRSFFARLGQKLKELGKNKLAPFFADVVKFLKTKAAPFFAEVVKFIEEYAQKHPLRTALIVTGVTLVLASLFAFPILDAIGFASQRIVAGLIAAGIQAGIGSVAAGSVFANSTSAVMGVYGVVAVVGVMLSIQARGRDFGGYCSMDG